MQKMKEKPKNLDQDLYKMTGILTRNQMNILKSEPNISQATTCSTQYNGTPSKNSEISE